MTSCARRWRWPVLIAVMAALAFTGCLGDDDDDDDDTGDDDSGPSDLEECLEEGRYWLSVGEGDRARLAYLCVLDLAPGHEEGLYGLAVADVVHLADVIGILKDYIMSVIDMGGPVASAGGDAKDEDARAILDRLIELVIGGLLLETSEELWTVSETLQAYEDPLFWHDGVPLIIDFELEGTMAGEFDRSYLVAAESFGRLLYGLNGHVLTVSLDLDISLAFLITEVDFEDVLVGIGDVVDILKLILNDPGHPNFLTLSEEGVDLYRKCGLLIGDGFDDFLSTWLVIGTETDDQTDDVIGYVDIHPNGAYDVLEPYRLPHFGELDATEMAALFIIEEVAREFRMAYWDRTVRDLDPDNPNPLHLDVLNPLLEFFGIPGIIPPDTTVPVGDWYAEPNPTAIRDFVTELVYVLDGLFPGSGQFE